MDARLIDRVETSVDRAASTLFGGAVAYAAYAWLSAGVAQPQLGAFAGGAGVVAFLACNRAMRAAAQRKPHLPVPVFNVRDIEFPDLAELILTDADRLEPEELVLTNADRTVPNELLLTNADRLNAQVHADPLVLDDILAEIGPEARVVRLFDRKAMPTPGQLKSRIDDHLSEKSQTSSSDAAQALSDALAELRRSLR
jgi:hypothetical protein